MDAAFVARIGSVRSGVNRIGQQLAYETSTITRLNTRITELEEEKTQLVKATGLIDRCIQIISANGIGKIESIVSDGLRRVFDDPTLSLVIDKKSQARGNVYRLLVKQGDGEPYDPMLSFGGGVVNVVAFLLRLILIKRFKLAKLIVLDEQFNGVSADRQPAVSALLRTLTDKYGYTILAVTHQPILADAADNVYQVLVRTPQPPLLKKVEGTDLDMLKVMLRERSAAEENQA